MQFEDLRLGEPLLRAVRAAGYRTPTPIQSNAIPLVLAGRDVLGCAQTGTGKTAAFALPILQRLSERASGVRGVADHRAAGRNGNGGGRIGRRDGRRQDPASIKGAGASSPGGVRGLVLCPTRELAQQIQDSFVTYGAHGGVRTAVIYGGVNQNSQVRAMRQGVDVLIATPGRLLDLMNQGFVDLSGVEILVLDEADRMLDMGFLPDIRRILSRVPNQRQSLLFSATMPAAIRKLAGDLLRDPAYVEVARVSSPAVTVAHWVYHVEKPCKAPLLVQLLTQSSGARALVFTRTKRGADRLTRLLVRDGVCAAAIHGNKSQGARTRALEEFRSARTPVLVATDLAARGLDVDDIAQVINYDLTPDPETYVHRIGRTGRAGASGVAISFCTAEERGDLRAIERLLGSPLRQAGSPGSGRRINENPPGTTGSTSPSRMAAADRPHAVLAPGRGAVRGNSRGRRRRRGRNISPSAAHAGV